MTRELKSNQLKVEVEEVMFESNLSVTYSLLI